MSDVMTVVGFVLVAAGVVGLYLTRPRPGLPCSFCGEPARVRPAVHPSFGPVCRRCGRYFRLPGA